MTLFLVFDFGFFYFWFLLFFLSLARCFLFGLLLCLLVVLLCLVKTHQSFITIVTKDVAHYSILAKCGLFC